MATVPNDSAPQATVWALRALALAGVGLSAFWIVKAATILAAPESEWVAPLPVDNPDSVQAATPALDVNFDAFHRGSGEVVEVQLSADLEETTLQLVLLGERAGPNGSAYIRTPDRKTDNYYIDDEIVPGVTLEAVDPGVAVIRRATGLERLTKARDTVLVTPQMVPTATPVSRDIPQTTRPPEGSSNPLAEVTPEDMLSQLDLQPATENGKPIGLTVRSRGGIDLSQFGLENGDVISKVDGMSLANIGPSGLTQLYERLSQQSSATLLVLRDGSPITLRIGR